MAINLIDEAIAYVRKGKSIIPLKKDKRPYLTEWREYQKRLPREDEVFDWWVKWPDANIGIVTGKVSGITVLDVDVRHGGTVDGLPQTLIVKTGNGGWHYYYKYKEGVTVGAGENSGLRIGVDVRGDGGYVVAPPSITEYLNKAGEKEGGKYEFALLEEMAEFPIELFPRVMNKKVDWENVMRGVGDGERNVTTTSLAGKLIGSFKKDDWEALAWPIMKMWNAKNNPPDDEKIVRRTFESVMKKHLSGHQEESTEEVEIIKMSDAEKRQKREEVVATGFPMFDEPMRGGIAVGSTVVVAAPSGHGKTAMMVTLTYGFLKQVINCLWFSYEETNADVWERFKVVGLDDTALAYCPLELADNKLDFIERMIKQHKQKNEFFVVFIDQLSYLAPKLKSDMNINQISGNYALYLGQVAQQLKDIAMEQKVIIIFAHQLGRTGELAYSEAVKNATSKAFFLNREQAKEGEAEEFTDNTFFTFKKNRVPGGGKYPRLKLTIDKGLFVEKKEKDDLVEMAKTIFNAKSVRNNKFNFN